MSRATFRFHAELNDFLPRRKRHTVLPVEFNWRASIKDMTESLGVPHSEVEAILLHGSPIGFEHIVQDADHAEIFPRFEHVRLPDGGRLPEEARLRPPLPEKPTFVLDIHLGRLAAYLRMLGFDARWRNDFPDDELAQIAHDERRVLLTRDVGCLKRGPVIYGYFVRAMNPKQRIIEVMERFELLPHVELFQRCMKCNGSLLWVSKDEVREDLPHDTALHFDDFRRCTSCERIYWKGSHFQRMQRLIDEVMAAVG